MLQREAERPRTVRKPSLARASRHLSASNRRFSAQEARDANSFERLVHLVRDNAQLFRELQWLTVQARRAELYLHEKDCNSLLGLAFLGRARARHAATLLRLRANRLEAQEILASSKNARGSSAGR